MTHTHQLTCDLEVDPDHTHHFVSDRSVVSVVTFDASSMAVFIDEMHRNIARAMGLPIRLLWGESSCFEDREARALLTLAPFPHTPE